MSNEAKTDEELNLAFEEYQAYWVDLPLPEAEDMAAEITEEQFGLTDITVNIAYNAQQRLLEKGVCIPHGLLIRCCSYCDQLAYLKHNACIGCHQMFALECEEEPEELHVCWNCDQRKAVENGSCCPSCAEAFMDEDTGRPYLILPESVEEQRMLKVCPECFTRANYLNEETCVKCEAYMIDTDQHDFDWHYHTVLEALPLQIEPDYYIPF